MKDLLDIAEYDMVTCKRLESFLPEEFAARGCSFHIQQAIEKVLKAYIMQITVEPPATHNIQGLLEIIKCSSYPFDNKLCDTIEDISDTLTVWAESGYSYHNSFSERKYNKAKKLYNDLKEAMLPYSGRLTINKENVR